MKKTIIQGKKHLLLAGLKIPYETERSGSRCRLIIGPLRLPYWRSQSDDSLCIPLFGRELSLRRDRRARHYAMRRRLTDEKIRELLTEELSPLLGYRPDLEHPRSFNEKINWMKLHAKDPLITRCCDKYAVKCYAAERIGEEYVLPVLGVWSRADEIDFACLPDRFVLKVNWSSGYNIIVRDKKALDLRETRRKLDRWMQPSQNSYYDMFNWGYKDMTPVIYAEPYIEQIDGQLYDYKLFCCGGKFKFLFVSTDRLNGRGLTYTFFDRALRPLPFRYGHKPNADPVPAMPAQLDRMIELAEKLAEPFPFVRADFYETDGGRVYLGEMTFYSGGGTLGFDPVEWDYTLGEWMD